MELITKRELNGKSEAYHDIVEKHWSSVSVITCSRLYDNGNDDNDHGKCYNYYLITTSWAQLMPVPAQMTSLTSTWRDPALEGRRDVRFFCASTNCLRKTNNNQRPTTDAHIAPNNYVCDDGYDVTRNQV